MADHLDGCEFWLPPEFLTDDDILMAFKDNSGGGGGGGEKKEGNKVVESDSGNGFNPFGPHSNLGTPVESVNGSVDTESDEEEYLTGLTRKMAQSTLEDSGFGYKNSKGLSLSGSPQSTLYGVLGGGAFGGKQSSNGQERPKCPSKVISPPPRRMDRSGGDADTVFGAAGEAARISIMENRGLCDRKDGMRAPKGEMGPGPFGPKNSNPSLGLLNSNQPSLPYQQLQNAQGMQFQQLNQQQHTMKQGQGMLGSVKPGFGQYPINPNHQQRLGQLPHNKGNMNGVPRPLDKSIPSWPTLQQPSHEPHPPQSRSGMRAIFLGNPFLKRGSAGTGVFLPRRAGSQTDEPRKKPGCSTVLLPERVVQALNLDLQAVNARAQQLQVQTKRSNNNGGCGFTPARAAAAQQNRNVRTQPPPAMSQELLLPQEWTY